MRRLFIIAGLLATPPAFADGQAAPFIVVAEEATAEKSATSKDKDAEAALPMPPVAAATPVEQTPGEQYCSSVFDAAAAARLAQQKSALSKAEQQIDARIAVLAAKTEELKTWIKTREDFTSRATDAIVQIYSKMKPDAAASQLMAMDEVTAAAVVSKLSPKANSLILPEMDATKAARLSAIIAGASEILMKPERKADAQ
jgi:flagellar motility protein MotE (MotC chaperone)